MIDDFQILEWDSKFFGFKVAKIEKHLLNIEKQEIFFQLLNQSDVRLAYYFSDVELDHNINSDYYDILLIDKKVPLVKPLVRWEIHPKVCIYEKDHPDEKLIELAQQAGIHTRFNTDPNIPKKKYEELFKIWIEKSVSKERATDVLVYMEEGEIIGFATIQLQEKGPYVSLLAVQKEYEGKGVSFALMNSIETILIDRGHTHVFGATQLDNRKAMVVYQRYGLMPQAVEYVYHFWKK